MVRVGLIAAAALLLVPGAAQACNDPTVSVRPNVAGPGDTMRYTITNLTAGAKYELSVEGVLVVPTREATSTSASGTFTMPDLGDRSGGISIGGPIEHWDIENSPTRKFDTDGTYRAPASTPTGPPESQPAPGTPPADVPGGREPGAANPAGKLIDDAPAHRAPQPLRATRPDGPGPQTAAPVEAEVPLAAPAPVTAEPDAVSSPRNELRAAPVAPGRPRATPAGPVHATVPQPAPPRPRTETVSAPEPGAPEHDGPAPPLMLVAALTAAGGCALWLMLLLRRGGEAAAPRATAPDPRIPPDASVEAELQEIVAEERARQLSRTTPAIRDGPGRRG
jgi:hypothetical protein